MREWTKVSAGDINAANQRLWVAFGDNADKVATLINTNPVFVVNIARRMVNGGYGLSTSQELARRIMGQNFFGIEEAVKYFKVKPTKEQLVDLAEVPWVEEQLQFCRKTHVLVAVFPLSFFDIQHAIVGLTDQPLISSYNEEHEDDGLYDKGKVGWQLVRKESVKNSFPKVWNDQQALLSKNEETPKVQVFVYATIGHFLVTKKRMFGKDAVRCIDTNSLCSRAVVSFAIHGLRVDYYLDKYCGHDFDGGRIGLASARK